MSFRSISGASLVLAIAIYPVDLRSGAPQGPQSARRGRTAADGEKKAKEGPAEPREGGEEAGTEPTVEQGTAPEGGRATGPTEQEVRVLDLFHASEKSFEDGKIVLTYDFESRDDGLLDDWSPRLAEARPRIHWSTSGESWVIEHESSYGSVKEDRGESEGLVLSDKGQWVHKAVFLADVEATVDVRNLAIHRPGTFLGPVFVHSRKKEAIGINGGFQVISIAGGAPRPVLPVRTDAIVQRMVKYSIGYRLQGRVMECLRNQRKVLDTSQIAKFAQGFEAGRVGLFWTGSIQCFVYRMTIKGRLDPDWVSEQLGEKGKKAAKG